jgi:hypothetical protein
MHEGLDQPGLQACAAAGRGFQLHPQTSAPQKAGTNDITCHMPSGAVDLQVATTIQAYALWSVLLNNCRLLTVA